MKQTLKVSAISGPGIKAKLIARTFKQYKVVELLVVGAAALNQAMKAVAIARGIIAPSGIDIVCKPSFRDLIIDGKERTAIVIRLEDR